MSKETATQRKRRLEKKKIKRQEKLQQEDKFSKSLRLAKRQKRQIDIPEEQKSAERAKAKVRMAASRGSETAEMRDSRLHLDRLRKVQSRINEIPEEHDSRLNLDRLRKVQSRINEIQKEHDSRLNLDRLRKAQSRFNETQEEHDSRLNLDRLGKVQSRINETQEEHDSRLNLDRLRKVQSRINETQEEYDSRLNLDRLRKVQSRINETKEEHDSRLNIDILRKVQSRINETQEEHDSRLNVDRLRKVQSRINETQEEHDSRLNLDRLRKVQSRINETQEEHVSRLNLDRLRHSQYSANENQEEHEARLQLLREAYAQRSVQAADFHKAINTYCDKTCEVCLKQCYPNQVAKYKVVNTKSYLPPELADKNELLVCHRCHTHLKSNKTQCPSKAYWNKLLPGDIPDEIKVLSEPEQRLLQRVIPYVKVIKFPGRFGQFGFKGHATLFALDIFEVSEKLPEMLPRSSTDTGIVVVTETLENLNISRDYSISPDRVYKALDWLIANNPLYIDVQVDHNARLNTQDVIRVIPIEPQQSNNDEHDNTSQFHSAYIPINHASRIIRASWHQGDTDIFHQQSVGRQCFVMVIANLIRAAILPPSQWETNVLNQNMIEADGLYIQIQFETNAHSDAFPIDAAGFLEIKNLDVIQNDILMFDNAFALEYVDEAHNGSLCDQQNDGINTLTLRAAINMLFATFHTGVLVTQGKSLGLIYSNNRYYFTDSHSCGKKGTSGASNGKACVIECDTDDELLRIVRRTVHSKHNTQYAIHGIQVVVKDNTLPLEEHLRQHPTMQMDHITSQREPEQEIDPLQFVPVQTSLMAPIDHEQPDLEEELIEAANISEIVRKTKDNIVNINHEKKAEEFAWFHLFPYGVNGLNEDREVKITPLDYYQQRILGKDTRFQKNGFLFYATSMVEYLKVQSTINAFAKKMQGENGAVEDLHLHLRNLRGSAAYWRMAHNELIAFIRCIGPPTWFITLSCNDINWLDMRKALLIADGRPDEDPSQVSINEAQCLIELYPIVLSRHFSRRVEAFMRQIKNNPRLLGGKVVDHWSRIEFQNRGSPHLHLVVWIEDAPSFETAEGVELINKVVSCRLPSEEEDPELRKLVNRNQIHRHTHTCHKNSSEACRFAFPRQPCLQTRVVPASSDEFIRNGGRFCSLKRSSSEKFVNNYNQEILEFWDGNMDIQPCGSNEAIAHYIAKYISKTEPTDVNEGVAQAIRQIRREETNIARKIFKSCMRILKERQVSASECAYRLCHLPLRSSSRKCIFLNTRKPEQRYHLLRFEGNQAVGLCSNIFERYTKRPSQQEQGYDFPKMSLLEFSMQFEPYYSKKTGDNEESIDAEEEQELPTRRRLLKLSDNSKMVIRNVPAVVRVPYFMMHTDTENYFYSLLLQYVPYYSENELIDEFDSAREAFLSREEKLRQTNAYLDAHRTRDKQLELAFNQAHAFDLLENPEVLPELELEEVTELGMSNEQFQNVCAGMNARQTELFNMTTRSIHSQLNGSEDRIRMFVTGGAGVGKTFTFNALKEQVNRCYQKKAAKVGALTGVAAKLVGGSTLHTLFRFKVEKDGRINIHLPPLTGNYLRVMRNQWKDVEFLFIDEISMVSYEMLCLINSRLQQLKNNNQCLFGGLNIIVFGDLMQLAPIPPSSPIYRQPARFSPATHLWRHFSLFELTDNMRQRGDTTYADLLNALRIGEMKAPHFDLLMSKLLAEETGEFAPNKAIRIYPTRDQVDEYNAAVLDQYRAEGMQILKIRAQDVLVDATKNADNVNVDNIVSTDINKTGGLPKELEIFVGARIMLRSNINVEQGLVNGAIGNIIDIIWPLFRRKQIYDTDIPSVRIDFGNNNIQLIQPKSVQFPALRNYGTIERRMLPLILCWACTVHKMQGCTVDRAVVYLGKKLFAKGQAYVALSRVKTLDGLRIEEIDCSKLTGKTPCNVEAMKEMERMRQYPSSAP